MSLSGLDPYTPGPGPTDYDTAQICRAGHVTNSSADAYPQHNQKFCSKCGQPTITRCEECQQNIRGDYSGGSGPYDRPSFCDNCGNAYPWTKTALEVAGEVSRSLELSSEEQAELEESVGELVRDSPRRPLAESKYKRLMKKAGKDAAETMRSILVDIVSEAVRKSIYP